MKYATYTALELGAKIKAGECSVTELAQATEETIAESDKALNAFITPPDAEKLQTEAREIEKKMEAGAYASPLAGVPIGIKDNICTKGVKTTCASKMLENFVPPYSATVVERLVDAGLLITGKLNMDEFAMGVSSETSYFGAVKNPWNMGHVPGGSSGGSAAAVASGMLSMALGSDTGGSIRQPAAFCGVTGFKPTYGRVSRFGAIAYASSLDQIGTITKDVADTAAILDIIAGHDPRDGTSLPEVKLDFLKNLSADIKGKRIALPLSSFADGVDEQVKQAVIAAEEVFKSQGAVVEEVDMPCLDYAVHVYHIIANAEASSNLARFDGIKYGYRTPEPQNLEMLYKKTRTEAFGEEVIERIMHGTMMLSADCYESYYTKAMQLRQVMVNELNELFGAFDAILLPVSPGTAPVLGESLQDAQKAYLADKFNVTANLAGLPALSVPAGFDANGLPIGVQLMAAREEDQTVLNLGYAFQQHTDYHRQMPTGKAGV